IAGLACTSQTARRNRPAYSATTSVSTSVISPHAGLTSAQSSTTTGTDMDRCATCSKFDSVRVTTSPSAAAAAAEAEGGLAGGAARVDRSMAPRRGAPGCSVTSLQRLLGGEVYEVVVGRDDGHGL